MLLYYFYYLFFCFCFFFFKQKTAYEIRLSLVGSEMCIRDSHGDAFLQVVEGLGGIPQGGETGGDPDPEVMWEVPFLPHLPVGVRLGLAGEGLPAECVILFPRRAAYVYHVEDLAVVGELLSARMLEMACSR